MQKRTTMTIAQWRDVGAPGRFIVTTNHGHGRVRSAILQRDAVGYRLLAISPAGGIASYHKPTLAALLPCAALTFLKQGEAEPASE